MDITEFSRLSNKSQYLRHPWEQSRKEVLLHFLRRSGIEFPIDRIVDIGGGDAYVIHCLVSENLAGEYFAIDTAYSPEVIKQLQINNNNSAVQYVQDLESYNSQHQTTGKTLYLCMDVLEHLKDEAEILKHLKPENNYYFFAVPAFQSVFSKHDELLGHYRRYTLEQLKTVLKKYNFDIKDSGYYFTSLLIFRWIDKLLKRDKEASIDNWTGGRVKTTLIKSILKADFTIATFFKKLGFKFYGLSCYCLCRK